MVRCLSYLNSMSDIVYKRRENFSSYNDVQYYCFQSAEMKESRAALKTTITGL